MNGRTRAGANCSVIENLYGQTSFRDSPRQRQHERVFICNRILTSIETVGENRVDLKTLPKSKAFLKRYGFICRVNGETASI